MVCTVTMPSSSLKLYFKTKYAFKLLLMNHVNRILLPLQSMKQSYCVNKKSENVNVNAKLSELSENVSRWSKT